MFNCPYCCHTFATKQRLISHLTRINKCYDVNVIGVPPVLLELLGKPKIQPPQQMQQTQPPQPVAHESSPSPPLLSPISSPQKPFACDIFRPRSENKPVNKIIRKSKPKTVSSTTNIKYIQRENYIEYLTEQMESKEDAMKFVRACIQSKIKGAINLLYKIYFDGRERNDYPLEVVDLKAKKIYYKTPDNVILDENATYVKSILIENLRNCYLQFCNHIIRTNIDDNNDIIFDEYDFGEIQKYILDLADDKRKDRIIIGLLEQLK